MKKSGGKAVRYNKWGYIFLIPFIVVFVIFQLVPLVCIFHVVLHSLFRWRTNQLFTDADRIYLRTL